MATAEKTRSACEIKILLNCLESSKSGRLARGNRHACCFSYGDSFPACVQYLCQEVHLAKNNETSGSFRSIRDLQPHQNHHQYEKASGLDNPMSTTSDAWESYIRLSASCFRSAGRGRQQHSHLSKIIFCTPIQHCVHMQPCIDSTSSRRHLGSRQTPALWLGRGDGSIMLGSCLMLSCSTSHIKPNWIIN